MHRAKSSHIVVTRNFKDVVCGHWPQRVATASEVSSHSDFLGDIESLALIHPEIGCCTANALVA
jgi:hypothetical protein